MTTLDEFCREHAVDRIDLLKIDVEGAELQVLRGGRGLLVDRRIDFIYAEFNEVLPLPDATGGALAPLCELLRPLGYLFVASYTDWLAPTGELFVVCNALFARRSPARD